MYQSREHTGKLFQSTPSVWRETYKHSDRIKLQDISIHSLRMEGDWTLQRVSRLTRYFNPLPPYGGRLRAVPPDGFFIMHFNPLPPYGGRLTAAGVSCGKQGISIHSLRMEGDLVVQCVDLASTSFQSTPSVWRETSHRRAWLFCLGLFQSTPSVWRETAFWFCVLFFNLYFNPLPPYGGRLSFASQISTWKLFQSTPSVWRETIGRWSTRNGADKFQSTPSVWRETKIYTFHVAAPLISIHSLRMEGDVYLVLICHLF